MSISSYRPGVYSSYTVTPSYTGAVEALTVGVIGELGMSESGPVRIGRERVLDAGTPLSALGGILFAAGLPEFWVCSLQQGEDGARPDAAAYKAAMEALGEAAELSLLVVESGQQAVLEAARDFALAQSESQRELLVFAGAEGNHTAAGTLAGAINCPRVVLTYGAVPPNGAESASPFWGAAALCGAVAVLEDPSVSLTGQLLPGVGKVSGATYAQVEGLLAAGVTPLAQTGAGVEAVRVLTTSTTLEGTANRSFSPINSILIIDYVMRALRRSLAALLRGAKNSPSTLSAVSSQLTVLLGDFLERGIITGYEAPRVSCPPETPEVCVAQVSFRAAYLINQIHIRAQIQL